MDPPVSAGYDDDFLHVWLAPCGRTGLEHGVKPVKSSPTHRQHSAHRPILAEKALSLCTSRNVVWLDVNKQLANQLRLKESDEAQKGGGGNLVSLQNKLGSKPVFLYT